MTISTTTARWEYTGDGSTTEFTYNNLIFEDSDLNVYVDGTLQELTTDYTVTNAGEETGGEVVFVSAPANDAEVTIVRDVPNTQGSDYPTGGPFPSKVTESDLDRRTVVSQDQQQAIERFLRVVESEQGIPTLELPTLAERAGKFLAFDENGVPIALAGSMTDAEVEDAYNNQVSVVTQAEAEAGTATIVRRWTAQRVKQAIAALETTFSLSTAHTFTAQQGFGIATLTDGASIAWNLETAQVAQVTLGGNRTLANPTNGINGFSYLLYVRQDATGSRTLAYGSEYDFGDDGEPTLTITASKGDLMGFVRVGGKMVFTGMRKGFSA